MTIFVHRRWISGRIRTPCDTGLVADWGESDGRETYDAIADAYADRFPSTEPEQPIDLAMIAHFANALGPDPMVLDAGCGAGRMMPHLAGLGCRVEGVDLSPAMVRRAQSDHCSFPSRVGSLAALPFAAGVFDGVFSWYSTIHGDDEALDSILREAHRVLAVDGLLLVAFQTGEGVHEVGRGIRDRGFDVRMMRYHRSAQVMARALDQCGFRPIASLDRGPIGSEADGQAVLIAQRLASYSVAQP
jgi:SAM-dependent methyltransferase